jgi:hypothetical protein
MHCITLLRGLGVELAEISELHSTLFLNKWVLSESTHPSDWVRFEPDFASTLPEVDFECEDRRRHAKMSAMM